MGRIALPSVDSTNAEAFRRAPHLAGPAWVLAAEQTAGRGRRARPWASPRGNFYATYVMQPTEAAATIALRSFVAALALHDALSLATGSPQGIALKWPNDVLLSGGKVAGILLECQTTGTAKGAPTQTLAIGIGVNLIGHPDPAQVEPGATPPVSVLSQSGQRHTPEGFLTLLAPAYAQWRQAYLGTLKKAAVLMGRNRSLLKSPASMANLDVILALFPNNEPSRTPTIVETDTGP